MFAERCRAMLQSHQRSRRGNHKLALCCADDAPLGHPFCFRVARLWVHCFGEIHWCWSSLLLVLMMPSSWC